MKKTKLEDWMLAIGVSMWVAWCWYDFTPKTWPPILGFVVTVPVIVALALWCAKSRRGAEPNRACLDRRLRQKQAYLWAKETFGEASASPRERALRVLEEALELAQATAGVDDGEAHTLVSYVFSKSPGSPAQEVGGVGCTLLAYAESIGVCAEQEERTELDRVLAIDKEVFRKRHNLKADAGVAVRAPE